MLIRAEAAALRPSDGGRLGAFAPSSSPSAINRRADSRFWPRTSTLGRFLSAPFQADGGVSVIGRRSGRSGDGADTVARERWEGGGGGIRGCGERGGFWGVTGLNYPRGVPSVGAVTRFQSRAALFERRRGARRRDVFGGGEGFWF